MERPNHPPAPGIWPRRLVAGQASPCLRAEKTSVQIYSVVCNVRVTGPTSFAFI